MKIATKIKSTLPVIILTTMMAILPVLQQALSASAEEGVQAAAKPEEGITEITDENFRNAVLKSKLPVVVDFYATWCGPCKMMEPVLSDLSREFTGKVKFVRVDVDRANRTALRYNINGLPTFLIFQDGKEKQLALGLTKSDVLKKAIEDSLH